MSRVGKGQDFLFSAPPNVRATTRRAWCRVTSLSLHKEVTKKRNSDVPSEASLGSRRRIAPSGRLCWQAFGKDFFHSVLFEISANKGALQVAKTFIFARCVLLPCWRFYIKTPTQALNMQQSAKTWGRARHRFCVAGIQGALGPLARFLDTSCRTARSVIKKQTARRAAVRVYGYADGKKILPPSPQKNGRNLSAASELLSNYFHSRSCFTSSK